MTVPVLLALAWAAFLARYGVSFVAQRRNSVGSMPGLSPLPEPSALRYRAAAFSNQPAVARRSSAARRRLVVLVGLSGFTALMVIGGLTSGARAFWALAIVSGTMLAMFVRALRVRAIARRQAHIDRLWSTDRYDELGHARVMSLEEARRRAQRIADPVYVPARRTS